MTLDFGRVNMRPVTALDEDACTECCSISNQGAVGDKDTEMSFEKAERPSRLSFICCKETSNIKE